MQPFVVRDYWLYNSAWQKVTSPTRPRIGHPWVSEDIRRTVEHGAMWVHAHAARAPVVGYRLRVGKSKITRSRRMFVKRSYHGYNHNDAQVWMHDVR